MRMSKRMMLLVTIVLATLWTSMAAQSAVIYVKQNSVGAQDGKSWATAFHSLSPALAAANAADDTSDLPSPGDEVWVAVGTYDGPIGIKTGVQVYGGFVGTESFQSERNWGAHPTIIVGDGKSPTVTLHSGSSMLSVIDGFVIENGGGTEGGGIYSNANSARISNNLITENTASEGAGIFCSAMTKLIIAGNVIAGNTSDTGAGICCLTSTGSITNNTIVENAGCGIYTSASTITAANNIVSANSTGIAVEGGAFTSKNNCVSGNGSSNYSGTQPGTTDIQSDPSLSSILGGDFHLLQGSPCIEAGDNAFVQPEIVDIDGDPRLYGQRVDIGADESNLVTLPQSGGGGLAPMAKGSMRTMDNEDPPPPAGIVYVNSACPGSTHDGTSWDTAYLTIQNGLNSAVSGNEVWVAAGSSAYSERITLKAGVGLYGGFAGTETARSQRNTGTNATVIDGGAGGSVVTTPGSCSGSTVIDGFTIRNGTGTTWGSTTNGGGIFCVGGGGECSPTISNNTITQNTSTIGAAGVFCYQSAPTISNNNITDNSMTNTGNGFGGGIFCSHSGVVTITGNTISGNASYFGGAIGCNPGNPYIANNTISNNTARHSGGGISCGTASCPTILNNVFSGNSTNTYGGGGLSCGENSNPIVGYNQFLDNTAHTSGAGINVSSSSPTIYGNMIAGNTSQFGGGIYVNGGSPTVFNNTVVHNTGTSASGGIHSQSASSTYTNNLVAFNTVGFLNSGGTLVLSHNNVYGNTTANYQYWTDQTGSNGNISVDPLLKNATSIPYDLHLLTTSPCIGVGDDTVVFSGMLDIDGQARINGTHVDIGADEPYNADVPTFSPAAGTYNSTQNVTISSTTPGASIYYTTDGMTPTSSSTLYSTPVAVSQNTTIKAIAIGDGYTQSDVATADYVIDTIAPTAGTATVASVTSTSPVTVSYSGAVDNAGGSGLDHVELWYKLGPTGTWTNSGVASAVGSGSFAFPPPGNTPGTYYFDLVAEDHAGNRSAVPSGNGDCSTQYEADLGVCQFSSIFAE